MIIHCDGSYDTMGLIGWGFVAQHAGEQEEMSGSRKVLKESDAHLHEMFAFVESVLYAHSKGLQPHEVSFYTDDQALVYGANYHNVVGWGAVFNIAPRMRQALNAVCKHFPEGTVELVLKYFEGSHLVWVKGHAGNIMNSRADYLAIRAMRRLKNQLCKQKMKKHRTCTQTFFDWFKDRAKTIVDFVLPFIDLLLAPKVPNLAVVSLLQHHHLSAIMSPGY